MGGTVDDSRVHHLSGAGGAGVVEGREQADDQVERTAGVVAEQVRGEGGRPVGVGRSCGGRRGDGRRCDEAEDAGHRRVPDVVPGPGGQRPVLPPAGHPPVDQRRIAGQTGVRPDPEPLGDPRPVPLDQQIGAGDQVEHLPRPLGGLEVDDHRTLVAVGDVVHRLDAERRRLGTVHPDHVGAEIAQQHRGERSGSDPGEFDHPDPGQRPSRTITRTTARTNATNAVHTAVTHGRHGPSEDRRSLTVKL